MLGSIYKGMIGMLSFSRGLNNIGGNVANLNTPGFKRADVHFREMLSPHSGKQFLGTQFTQYSGVESNLTSINFSQGEISTTGNNTDLAINGNGFFILRNDRETLYSRVGEFEFDNKGFMVARGTDFRVAGIGANGRLTDINIRDFRASNPVPSGQITMLGNLSTGSTTHTVSDVEVYDEEGTLHVLSVQFTNNGATTPRSWTIEIRNDDDEILATGLEIRFNANGSPAEGFNSVAFDVESEDGRTSSVSIYMGEPGSFNQVTSFSGGASSTVEAERVDGNGPGIMIGFDVTDRGSISVNYSNGVSEKVTELALARFESPGDLLQQGGGFLKKQDFQTAIIGTAGTLGIGTISDKSIELSNVDLTDQFGQMIVLQRGYQASSQVMTTANEMLQQLMDATRGR